MKGRAVGAALDPAGNVYVSDFSSRALPGQELDVLAPGSWVRGPFAGDPGYNHLPWWSKGIGDLVGRNVSNFFYVGGTSMATPHVASVAALMLQKNPNLMQSQVEGILKSTALTMPSSGSRTIFDFTVPNVTISSQSCSRSQQFIRAAETSRRRYSSPRAKAKPPMMINRSIPIAV